MKESNFQSKFGKWIKDNKKSLEIRSAVYELKLEKEKSFAFNKVRPHQVEALYNAKHKGEYHKINDLPVYSGSGTRFASKKPFDCFFLKGVEAYFVIGFYTPRQKIEALFVDIDRFIKVRDYYLKEGRKSLKKDEWKSISKYCFKI